MTVPCRLYKVVSCDHHSCLICLPEPEQSLPNATMVVYYGATKHVSRFWLFALIITILFQIAILFQFISWKGFNNVENHDKPILTNVPTTPSSKNVILTSFFRYLPDPQRGTTPAASFQVFANLYNSLNFYGLHAIIFHNDLPDHMVKKYVTAKINFRKIEVPTNMSMSTNDFRFKVYGKFLEGYPVQHVLFVDAFDVFFLGDPFQYMEENGNHQMYFSADIGTFHAEAWRVKACYGFDEPRNWDQSLPMVNAGAWGGQKDSSLCMLNCINEQLSVPSRYQRNCNMPAVNWCAHFSGCLNDPVRPDTILFNPFRQECMGDPHHIVVHNKCLTTEGKLCVVLKEGKLAPVPKKNGTLCEFIGSNENVDLNEEESVQDIVTKCLPMTEKQKIDLASEIKDYMNSPKFHQKINEVKSNEATPIHTSIAKYLTDHVLQANWSILELGCAAGMMLQMVGDACKGDANLGSARDLVGIELTTGWVKFAENHFDDISIYEGDITDFDLPAPYTTVTFDFVMLNDVMEHIQKDRYGCFFDMIKKKTHRGSVVYMHTPTPEFQLTETDQYYENVLPHHHVILGMALAGFELVALDHDMEVGCLSRTPTLHVPKRIQCAHSPPGKWPLFYHMIFHRSADDRVFKLH